MTFQYQLDILEVTKHQPIFTSLFRQWASESKAAHGLGYVIWEHGCNCLLLGWRGARREDICSQLTIYARYHFLI